MFEKRGLKDVRVGGGRGLGDGGREGRGGEGRGAQRWEQSSKVLNKVGNRRSEK